MFWIHSPDAQSKPKFMQHRNEKLMIPRVIHYTVPAKTNAIQEAAIQLARDLHPDWTIRVWRDPLDPKDFRLGKYWSRVNSGAQLADLIRLEVVHLEGGVYLDSDITMLRPMDDLLEHSDFCICSEDGLLATNAMFGASKGSAVLAAMIEDLLANEPDWTLSPVTTTGPEFMTRLLVGRNDYSVLPRESFYPYLYNEQRRLHPQSHGCHEWAGSWTKSTFTQKLKGFAREAHPKTVLWKAGKATLRGMESNTQGLGVFVKNFNLLSKIVPDRHMPRHVSLLAKTSGSNSNGTGSTDLSMEIFLKRILKGGDFVVHCGTSANSTVLLCGLHCGRFGRSIHLGADQNQQSEIQAVMREFGLEDETFVFLDEDGSAMSIKQVMPFIAPIAAVLCASPDHLNRILTSDVSMFKSGAISTVLMQRQVSASNEQVAMLNAACLTLEQLGYQAATIDAGGKQSQMLSAMQLSAEIVQKNAIAFMPVVTT
jgi:hypothetical protein